MNALTNIQVINGPNGAPAFVVIPYGEYIANQTKSEGLIPHSVISSVVDGATPARAWREHLGLTQADIAARLGISQSAYAQQENSERLRRISIERIAAALEVSPEQLDI